MTKEILKQNDKILEMNAKLLTVLSNPLFAARAFEVNEEAQ